MTLQYFLLHIFCYFKMLFIYKLRSNICVYICQCWVPFFALMQICKFMRVASLWNFAFVKGCSKNTLAHKTGQQRGCYCYWFTVIWSLLPACLSFCFILFVKKWRLWQLTMTIGIITVQVCLTVSVVSLLY